MSGQGDDQASHGDYVPDTDEFAKMRAQWRTALSEDELLRQQAVSLHVAAEEYHYTYTWEWCGVPIIRVPDDIVMLQELFWHYRPERVVETGIARGGSLLLNASMMRMAGIEPAVLGIDHKIFPHTRQALDAHPFAIGLTLLEADSTSQDAAGAVRRFVAGADRVILILDSNHTHEHVLAELRALAVLLPAGGFVLVADTVIEEFPADHFVNRPWNRGNNPLTAVREFLSTNVEFQIANEWARRSLLSEFRDGVIVRSRPASS